MTSSSYRLYGRANAGSLAVQIVLEEIGAPYELIWVGRTTAELEALRRINPPERCRRSCYRMARRCSSPPQSSFT